MSRYNKSDSLSVLAICPRTVMVQNNLILRQRIIHSPASSGVCASERTNERSGAREQSEQCRANERVVRANGRPNGPIRTTRFMAVLYHCVVSLDIGTASAIARQHESSYSDQGRHKTNQWWRRTSKSHKLLGF